MQIGKGKQGVIVSEYGDNGSGFLGYIEPARDKNQWIMWFDAKGDAVLYTERETGLEPEYHQEGCSYRKGPDFPCTCGGPVVKRGGAVIGDPIRIKAKGRTRRTTGAPQASITGNMEIGRAKINGEDFITLKVDKEGGTLKHVWPDGEVSDIVFGEEGDGHDYEGRNPEDCVNLVGRTQTIILVNRVDSSK
jgi:hypothetical protein